MLLISSGSCLFLNWQYTLPFCFCFCFFFVLANCNGRQDRFMNTAKINLDCYRGTLY